MTSTTNWLAALITIAIVLIYEGVVLLVRGRNPGRLARSAHATLREDWFLAISNQPGSEIVAIQTLRNSLMSATMTASTAVLGLMGTFTLLAPALNSTFEVAEPRALHFTARLALELLLMMILFASSVFSAMAVRYYNHAGFISSMPVGSDERQRWSATGVIYLRRAGIFYSWGLRHLLMVAPILASIALPLAGPGAALVLVIALFYFDRFSIK